jgi:hypothetical protein
VVAQHPRYVDHRYRHGSDGLDVLSWAQDQHDERIGTIGTFAQAQYPLAGADLSNHVRYLVVETADGGARPPGSCDELARVIERGRYDYVVIIGAETIEWVQQQPDAMPVPGTLGSTPGGFVAPQPVQVFALERDRRDRAC